MITKQFVHLHFPRTGGTSLRTVLLRDYRDRLDILEQYNHPPRAMVAEIAAGVPRFILTRDCWSWYVSWYLWCKQTFLDMGSFETFLHWMIYNAERGPLYIPNKRFGTCSETFAGFTRDGVEAIGRYETLDVDYALFVSGYTDGAIPYDELRERLSECHERSTKLERHYSLYYTDELRDLVAVVDAEYIERFGYEFEDLR